jgi:hypothetical protein
VPWRLGALEHASKDGSPWVLGDFADLGYSAPSASPLAHLRAKASEGDREIRNAVTENSVPAKARPDTLTAIMEGVS